jgi:hypothetical protein
MSDQNAVRELNRQLQGLQARVRQNEITTGLLFAASSQICAVAVGTVPALSTLIGLGLNGTPVGFGSLLNGAIAAISPTDTATQLLMNAMSQISASDLGAIASSMTDGIQARIDALIASGVPLTDPRIIALQNALATTGGFLQSQVNITLGKTKDMILGG